MTTYCRVCGELVIAFPLEKDRAFIYCTEHRQLASLRIAEMTRAEFSNYQAGHERAQERAVHEANLGILGQQVSIGDLYEQVSGFLAEVFRP